MLPFSYYFFLISIYFTSILSLIYLICFILFFIFYFLSSSASCLVANSFYLVVIPVKDYLIIVSLNLNFNFSILVEIFAFSIYFWEISYRNDNDLFCNIYIVFIICCIINFLLAISVLQFLTSFIYLLFYLDSD